MISKKFSDLPFKKLVTFICFSFFIHVASAQLIIDDLDLSPQEMAETIFNGEEFFINNATFVGDSTQIAYFRKNNSNAAIDSGLVMVTAPAGRANGTSFDEIPNYASTDPDFQMLSDNASYYYNNAILEFDVVLTTDTLRLFYSFGSYEYTAFTCSNFNDQFGILISGPGFDGDFSSNAVNLAMIPGKDVAVSINSVNVGAPSNGGIPEQCELLDPEWQENSIYFVNNSYNTGNNAGFPGFTVRMEAKTAVIPGETYHIKILIAEAVDPYWDSGIFIEAKAELDPCPLLDANIGDACDDGDGDTVNDQINVSCECEGMLNEPNLQLTAQSFDYYLAPFDSLDASFEVKNIGLATSEPTNVIITWGHSFLLNENDSVLASFEIPALNYNEEFSFELEGALIPLPLEWDQYYLKAFVEPVAGETIIDNNSTSNNYVFTANYQCFIHVEEALSEIDISLSDIEFQVSFNIYNLGPYYLPDSPVNIYWSTDTVVSINDVLLEEYEGPFLDQGDTVSVDLTLEILQPITQNPYYLLIEPQNYNSVGDEMGIIQVNFLDFTGIVDMEEAGWKIYQSNGQVMINPSLLKAPSQDLYLYNSTGQLLFTKKISLTSNAISRVNIPSNLAQGIYHLQIIDGDRQVGAKLFFE